MRNKQKPTTKKFLAVRKDAEYISDFDRQMAKYLKGGEPT